MPFMAAIGSGLGLLIALGLTERLLRDRAWKAVPIRIHVNGTRGKSSVTRLIWAALREAGIPALAKTTGAASRLLLPDGREQPLLRRGKANIREQLRTVLLAQRLGAGAVVLECMALAPELQWVAEREMVQATIGVITNVRTDHTEVMGQNLHDIAACLSNTVPSRSVLVIGSREFADLFSKCAIERGSRVVVASPDRSPSMVADPRPGCSGFQPSDYSWQAENQATALAVARELGIDDITALAGMRNTPPDPGTTATGRANFDAKSLPYFDARSANDPESFLLALNGFTADSGDDPLQPKTLLLIFNHRSDRPHRLLHFADSAFPSERANRIIITGDRPALSLWLAVRRAPGIPLLQYVAVRRLPAALAELSSSCRGIVFCGNTHGLDLSEIVK